MININTTRIFIENEIRTGKNIVTKLSIDSSCPSCNALQLYIEQHQTFSIEGEPFNHPVIIFNDEAEEKAFFEHLQTFEKRYAFYSFNFTSEILQCDLCNNVIHLVKDDAHYELYTDKNVVSVFFVDEKQSSHELACTELSVRNLSFAWKEHFFTNNNDVISLFRPTGYSEDMAWRLTKSSLTHPYVAKAMVKASDVKVNMTFEEDEYNGCLPSFELFIDPKNVLSSEIVANDGEYEEELNLTSIINEELTVLS